MTMKLVGKTETKPRTFPMCDMKNGQVCVVQDAAAGGNNGKAVMKVVYETPGVILVLQDHDASNCYSPACELHVRALYPGESITVEFS